MLIYDRSPEHHDTIQHTSILVLEFFHRHDFLDQHDLSQPRNQDIQNTLGQCMTGLGQIIFNGVSQVSELGYKTGNSMGQERMGCGYG